MAQQWPPSIVLHFIDARWHFLAFQRASALHVGLHIFPTFLGRGRGGAEPVTPLNYGTVHFSAEKIPALANKASHCRQA